MNLIISLVILMGFLHTIHTDCGCNKQKRQKRNDIYPSSSKLNEKKPESVLKTLMEDHVPDKMSFIPGGTYQIGTNKPKIIEDREDLRNVTIEDFFIDRYEVSNLDFQTFIVATGYKTETEVFGDSFVFQLLISDELKELYNDYRVKAAPWWYKIKGVDWKHPEGPESNINDRLDHPVVHVSWLDAVEYCKWQSKRLPTEAEWEVACRGGKKDKLYPWGDKMNPKDKHWMNIWQGNFPDQNDGDDGYISTNPVTKFKQNDYNLHNMVGNVWEWTADLWDSEVDVDSTSTEPLARVKKGGSYLCHESYCYRYRCAARSQNTADSSAGNLGFRCAKNH